jgi:anti-sigma factor RsiW
VTCREFADFILDYLSGGLVGEVQASFDRHLSRCPSCRAYLAQYRVTVAAGKQAFAEPDAALPAEVPEDLVRAILSSRRSAR